MLAPILHVLADLLQLLSAEHVLRYRQEILFLDLDMLAIACTKLGNPSSKFGRFGNRRRAVIFGHEGHRILRWVGSLNLPQPHGPSLSR